MKWLAAIGLSATFAACASSGFNSRPQDIPALEQRVTAQPNNAEALTSLGIAYYNAKRYDDARATLAKATGSKSGAASLYLGLANEELKDWTAARTAYEAYLKEGTSKDVKERIRSRLALVAREQLKQDAKAVVAREQQMSEEAPTPRTVAVMPFRMVGTSEEIAPLQTALTDMIITDLAVSPAITSIERVKINSLIDEMLLAQAAFTEPSTGARVGRLLKAEHIVQGSLAQSGDKDIRMDATILNTARREAAGNFGQSQQLEQIFDLEKQIVFNIFNTLGVTLTAVEREKINENRTGNLLAFLAYGRGLNELDRGNFQQASTFFRQATQLDPNFTRASATNAQATQLQQASQTTTTEIAQAATVEAPVAALSTATTSLLQSTLNDVNPTPATQTTQTSTTTQSNTSTSQASNTAGNLNQSQGNTGGASQAAKATVQIRICNPSKGAC